MTETRQGTLFDLDETELDPMSWLQYPASEIERAFVAFHRSNPQVYAGIERLALELWRKRRPPRIGIAMLYETLRYTTLLQTEGDAFKLNNNFRALYARLLVDRWPELAGVVELRERREEGAVA